MWSLSRIPCPHVNRDMSVLKAYKQYTGDCHNWDMNNYLDTKTHVNTLLEFRVSVFTWTRAFWVLTGIEEFRNVLFTISWMRQFPDYDKPEYLQCDILTIFRKLCHVNAVSWFPMGEVERRTQRELKLSHRDCSSYLELVSCKT